LVLKKDKMNGIIQREISDILRKEVKNPKLGFLTVTDVEVTTDLSFAKIYVSILGKGYQKKEALEALDQSKGYIRSALAKRLTTRKVPELKFVFDESLEYSNHINTILKDIQNEED
jgi:ribosome-binding factor A